VGKGEGQRKEREGGRRQLCDTIDSFIDFSQQRHDDDAAAAAAHEKHIS